MVYDSFHVLRAFPRNELPISARAFTDDPLDVRHFSLAAEFSDLG
jgi:hypothetical protein